MTFSRFLISLVFIGIAFLQTNAQDQKQSYKVSCIGFYNLENLFDTVYNEELFLNEEFTPESKKRWNSEKYHQKLTNMAKVISKIGTEYTPEGVALLGVSEIENRGVLEDLVKQPAIADRKFEIVHYNSPDRRGVDVGLLYNPKYFSVSNSKSYPLNDPFDTSFFTRAQLVVSGDLRGDQIHVIVNHWPSRSGGEKRSRPKRNLAADLSRYIVDSLLTMDPEAKIFVIGDLNDDPFNESVKIHLRGIGKEKDLKEGDLYNPYFKLYRDGIGSLAYRDEWNLFDQIIISQSLLGDDRSSFKFYKAMVFNKNFLKQQEGRYAGYPHRTYVGSNFLGGYSDHFPVYVVLIKEKK